MSYSIVKNELSKAVLKMDKHLTEVWDDMLDNCEEGTSKYQTIQEICDEYWYPIKWAANEVPFINDLEADILKKALILYAKRWREHIEEEEKKSGGNYIFHPNFADQTCEDLSLKLEKLTSKKF